MTFEAQMHDRNGLGVPASTWPEDRQAPEALELVRRFVNTYVVENGADVLLAVADLREWIKREIPQVSGSSVTSLDLDHARALRSALREAIVTDRVEVLDAAAGLVHLQPRFLHGIASLEPVGVGWPLVAGMLVSSVFAAATIGTLTRLVACDHCGWVIYDHSRRRNARWCSESACASRERARQYRKRVREHSV